jgi:hypothetical protein
MRKLLLCAVVAVFLMATAMPASAVHIRSAADKGISEIEIGGELLTRGWLFDETYTNDRADGATGNDSGAPDNLASNKTNSIWQTNFVLDTAYIASEDLKGVWTIEIEDIVWGDNTGSGGNLGTNQANVLTNQLFVEFNVPTVPVAAKVGLQNFTVGHSVILDDEAGGVNFNVAVDPIDVNLFTFKRDERDFDEYDDTDYYGATINVALGDTGSVGVFGIWGHANGDQGASELFDSEYDVDGTSGSKAPGYFDRYDAWWYGITADLAMDPIEIAAEVDFYQAKWNAETGNRDFHGSGYFAWLDVGANIGDLGKAGIAGFIASGNPNDSYLNNDGGDTFKSNNFTNISAWDRTDGTVLDWDNLFVRDGVAFNGSVPTDTVTTANDNRLQNMTSAKVYAALSPLDWLSTGLNANFYWKANDFRGNEDGERNYYGVEVDLDVAVQIYDQLVLAIDGGYMFTTDSALDPNVHTSSDADNATGEDNDKDDNRTVDSIWAVTSTLVYSF